MSHIVIARIHVIKLANTGNLSADEYFVSGFKVENYHFEFEIQIAAGNLIRCFSAPFVRRGCHH